MSELENDTASDQGTVKSMFESLFDDEPSQQHEETEKASPSFASEAASAGYYSYETSSNAKSFRSTRANVNSTRPSQMAQPVKPAEVQVEADATAFDLRQAIIYQTILDNKYLSDTQSYGN